LLDDPVPRDDQQSRFVSALEPAAFLDRDGTLIEDVGFPRDPELVRLVEGAAAALRCLAAANMRLVVVSNQSGIGRGLISVDEARSVHERFVGLLADEGIVLDGSKYCPHPPEAGCDCRKPSPGMLLEAAEDLRLDLGRSFMIGDKVSDVEAGRRAGCRTVLLGSGTTDEGSARGPDFDAPGWSAAIQPLLESVAAR
jgi:D-glycero-D-manno-heptose 1,7-bisphosphate phosphatase